MWDAEPDLDRDNWTDEFETPVLSVIDETWVFPTFTSDTGYFPFDVTDTLTGNGTLEFELPWKDYDANEPVAATDRIYMEGIVSAAYYLDITETVSGTTLFNCTAECTFSIQLKYTDDTLSIRDAFILGHQKGQWTGVFNAGNPQFSVDARGQQPGSLSTLWESTMTQAGGARTAEEKSVKAIRVVADLILTTSTGASTSTTFTGRSDTPGGDNTDFLYMEDVGRFYV